jgi:hypothetical protein
MDREEITPLAIWTDNLTVTRAVIVTDYKNVGFCCEGDKYLGFFVGVN